MKKSSSEAYGNNLIILFLVYQKLYPVCFAVKIQLFILEIQHTERIPSKTDTDDPKRIATVV